MKKLLLVGFTVSLGAFMLTYFVPPNVVANTVISKGKDKTLTVALSTGNTISIIGVFNEAMRKSFHKSIYSSKSKTIHVYINSPGGDLFEMYKMTETMKYSGKKFVCFTDFAASAAFVLFQHCDARFLVSSGYIMTHKASGIVYGEVNKMKSRMRLAEAIINKIDAYIANRLNIPVFVYDKMTSDETWMDVDLARGYGAIDGVVGYIFCSKELTNKIITVTRERCSLFGGCKTIKEKVSACPLLR